MYLHIGKNIVVEEKKIIGIFNIEKTKKNNEYKNIEKYLIDISEGLQKTLILIDDKNIKGYITNISSITLKKRI